MDGWVGGGGEREGGVREGSNEFFFRVRFCLVLSPQSPSLLLPRFCLSVCVSASTVHSTVTNSGSGMIIAECVTVLGVSQSVSEW